MTPTQFTSALKSLGLRQIDAAELLGITDRAIRTYVAGTTKVPQPIAKILHLLLAGKLKLKDLENA